MRPLLLISAIVFAGCVTPSIPIPPPDPARMEFHLTGDVNNHAASFAYPPDVNYVAAVVFVYNRDLGPVSYTHLTLPTNREV